MGDRLGTLGAVGILILLPFLESLIKTFANYLFNMSPSKNALVK